MICLSSEKTLKAWATLAAVAVVCAAPQVEAKVVWSSDFEGITDVNGFGTFGPDGKVDIHDVDSNQDGRPDGLLIAGSGQQADFVTATGPTGAQTDVFRLKSNAVNQDVRFRVENDPNGNFQVPRQGFDGFTVNDQDDAFDFTRLRVTTYMQVVSAGNPGVFGRGISVRQGGTSGGANLVNILFNTQIGAGDTDLNSQREINKTLNFGYGAGRAPGDSVASNANDQFGAVDPIGVALSAASTDQNGDGQVNPLPAPFYQRDSSESGLPFAFNEPPVVDSVWHDFGQLDTANDANNNTGGWVKVDLMIDADADRTPHVDDPTVALNTFTISLTHLASGDTVTETHRIYSDDVNLRSDDPFMGFQMAHGAEPAGTETWYDDTAVQALLYGDINFDDAIDSADIDALYSASSGGIDSVDAKLNDLNYSGDVSLAPNTGSDVDELVRVVFGTEYGDVDLDGTVDASDRSVVESNQGALGLGWAGGDLNGDGVTDNLDLAFFAGGLAGDYNRDGVVNAADYTLWRDTENASVPNGTGADGNGDGVVDGADYSFWATRLGGTAPAFSASVPEPAAGLLFIQVGLGVFMAARRSRC